MQLKKTIIMSSVQLHENDTATENVDENYGILLKLCEDNKSYFTGNGKNTQKLHSLFISLINEVNNLWPSVIELRNIARKYDFDNVTLGNGFDSFAYLVNCAFLRCIKAAKKIYSKRSFICYKKSTFIRKLETCVELLTSLIILGNNLKLVSNWLKDDNLFPQDITPEEYSQNIRLINNRAFFGNHIAFQFDKNIRQQMRTVFTYLAIISEIFYKEGSLFTKAKYLLDEDFRTKRIVKVINNCNVQFVKRFWFTSERGFTGKAFNYNIFKVEVSQLIHILPKPLSVTVDNRKIDIPIPDSHIGKLPVQIRLISHVLRDGMFNESLEKNKFLSPSKNLIFHCHGGGGISQTSKSHESYLRKWSQLLKVPVVSVDYSLCPEAPFPRAIEEIVYAYGWVLNNLSFLGTTGEGIVFAGDSMGGTLMISALHKCLLMGIPPPVGLCLLYAPTLANFTPCPSRHLCNMDPLVPVPFSKLIITAYAGIRVSSEKENDSNKSEEKDNKIVVLENEISNSSNDNDVKDGSPDFVLLKREDREYNPTWNLKKTETYTLFEKEHSEKHDGFFDADLFKNTMFNVYLTPDDVLKQFPPTKILTTNLDPFLDDSVEFAKKIKKVGNDVTLDIVKGVPHGFLNFMMVSKEAENAGMLCVQRISELFDLSHAK